MAIYAKRGCGDSTQNHITNWSTDCVFFLTNTNQTHTDIKIDIFSWRELCKEYSWNTTKQIYYNNMCFTGKQQQATKLKYSIHGTEQWRLSFSSIKYQIINKYLICTDHWRESTFSLSWNFVLSSIRDLHIFLFIDFLK